MLAFGNGQILVRQRFSSQSSMFAFRDKFGQFKDSYRIAMPTWSAKEGNILQVVRSAQCAVKQARILRENYVVDSLPPRH